MYETHVTVVGNVATRVEFSTTAAGVPLARFRLASTMRRFDAQERMWSDVGTNFFTVWTRRALAENVASSVTLGEPVIVTGRLRIREPVRDGQQQYFGAELSASSVGHDLSRGTSAFVRVSPARRGLTASGQGDDGVTKTAAPPGTGKPVRAGAEAKVPGQSGGP
ncbi:single-stranded DNA-binding protein [Streptomyces marispadix]|uniref:Single-stranded DNA-binding protein n=1 Tax=Streptomyces marispadix TaxID=2922868 RepID=A0ABS9SVN7_9ACTN|nr:single-stranded DNA-binding protein [Streptomyces marispadix]MCH6160330.1 single-stranded DNA-binding protein [Streptomyces marispadix]